MQNTSRSLPSSLWLLALALPFALQSQTPQAPLPPDTLRSAWARAAGDSLLGAKQFDASTRAYERGIPAYTEAGDTLNLNLAALYHQIGNNWLYQERHREGIGAHQKSLNIRLKRRGSESMSAAEAYQSLGVAYQKARSIDTAILYSRLCLQTHLKEFGLYHETVPTHLIHLGNCYLGKESLDSAKWCYQQALAVYDSLRLSHRSGTAWSNLGYTAQRAAETEEAIRCYKKAADLIAAQAGENSTDMLMPWLNLSSVLIGINELDSAIFYLQKCLRVSIPAYGESHPEVAREWANLALCYGSKGDLRHALELLFKAEQVFVKNYGPDHPDLALIYNSIANSLEGHLRRQSLDYLHKALYIIKKNYGEHSGELVNPYNNIAENYAANHEYSKAVKYIQKAIKAGTQQKGGDDRPVFGVLYGNAGNYYAGLHQWDTALFYYQKAIAARLKYPKPWPAQQMYLNLGNLYSQKGECAEAFRWYARYDSCQRATQQPMPPNERSELYQGLGECHLIQGDHDAALRAYNEAIAATGYTGNTAAPGVEQAALFDAMAGKGHALRLRYGKSQDLGDLYAAAALYAQMFAAERMKQGFFPKKGGEGPALDAGTAVVENALATALALQKATGEARWADTAFALVEQSRAMALYAAMKSAEARRFGQVDSALLAREYHLRVEIAWQERRHYEARERGDLMAADRAAALAADARRAYDDLKKQLEADYPDYYRLQYDRRTLTASEVRRQMLDDSTTLLEYFVGDSTVYIFALDRDSLLLLPVPKGFPLEQWVQQMRNGLTDRSLSIPKNARNAQKYAEAAFQIHQHIVLPVAHRLRRKVVVAPDGPLGLVPFDVLLTARPERPIRFGSHAYLGKKHCFSLGFSATLLHEMQEKKHATPAKETLLALAPFFRGDTLLPFAALDTLLLSSSRDVLSSLPHSGPEAMDAAQRFSGRVLLGTAATKEIFLRLAALYRILHLSTHGKANDSDGEYAYLAFSVSGDTTVFDKFYVREIYNLLLNADLVTLSACETGSGELRRSEGIISLARAFAYAGAKSILTTLWSVDDLSTQRLMQFFYQNLGKGMDKDEALWRAKQDFMATYPDSTHPYFWSGFFVLGDTAPLR